MSDDYQKCVRKIVIEENQWKHKGGSSKQVSIYFEPRVFRYCPRFLELRAVILLLIELYGKEYVEKEMGMELEIKNDKER